MDHKLVATLSAAAVVALVPLSGAQATTVASNLVINPGYDSGMTSWLKDSSSSATVASSAGRSGNGLKITATGDGTMGVKQTLTQKSAAGKTYVVTASLKAGSQTSTVNGGLVVAETRSNGTKLCPGVTPESN